MLRITNSVVEWIIKTMAKIRFSLCVFLFTFSVYLFTLYPTVSPYRDAGELASVSYTLGIAHPTGYPVYTILGKIFCLIPFGNIGYRVNCLSAFFAALTALMIFLCLRKIQESFLRPGALFVPLAGSLLWAFSPIFWGVSGVSEMYTLHIFLMMVLFYILLIWSEGVKNFQEPAVSYRYLYLFSFLFGLSIGNHMTILIAGPSFAFIIWKGLRKMKKKDKKRPGFQMVKALSFFLMGLSVYMYLLLRARQAPLLNWCNPGNLSNFLYSVLRKGYGSGLDTISQYYTLKEVIGPQMKHYFASLVKQFTLPGLFLISAGFYQWIKRERVFSLSLLLLFLLSGPLFILWAKMPSNPHALAIIEPHYLMPNLALLLGLAGTGFYLTRRPGLRWMKPLLLLMPGFILILNFTDISKRENFLAHDFGRNILEFLPGNSVVLLRKDAPIFTLWYLQIVEKVREDVKVLAQALTGSYWYGPQKLVQWPGIVFGNLRRPEELKEFILRYGAAIPLFFGYDVEMPEDFFKNFQMRSSGLVNRVSGEEAESGEEGWIKMKELYRYRGAYSKTEYDDFFSQDMLTYYAIGLNQTGIHFWDKGQYSSAAEAYLFSLSTDREFSNAYYNLGINFFSQQKYKAAILCFLKAVDLSRDYAEAYNNLGASYERMGVLNKAIEAYRKAIHYKEDFSEAYYNLGVVYWKRKEWGKVEENFRKALIYNPNHARARKFLKILQERR